MKEERQHKLKMAIAARHSQIRRCSPMIDRVVQKQIPRIIILTAHVLRVPLVEQSVIRLAGQVDFLSSFLAITRTNVQPHNVENRSTSVNVGADVETGLATEQTDLKAKYKI